MTALDKINIELGNSGYAKHLSERFGMKYRRPVHDLEHLSELRSLLNYSNEQVEEQILCDGCSMQSIKELIKTL